MIVAGAIPGVLVLAFVMKMPLGAVLLGLLLGTFTSVLVSMACLTIDMHRPWLTWTEPAGRSSPISTGCSACWSASPWWESLSGSGSSFHSEESGFKQ